MKAFAAKGNCNSLIFGLELDLRGLGNATLARGNFMADLLTSISGLITPEDAIPNQEQLKPSEALTFEIPHKTHTKMSIHCIALPLEHVVVTIKILRVLNF